MILFGAEKETKLEIFRALKYPRNFSLNSIASSFKLITDSFEKRSDLKTGQNIIGPKL
jgi:hypothetical protein